MGKTFRFNCDLDLDPRMSSESYNIKVDFFFIFAGEMKEITVFQSKNSIFHYLSKFLIKSEIKSLGVGDLIPGGYVLLQTNPANNGK